MINPPFAEPLAPETARGVFRQMALSGGLAFSEHALEEMEKDGLEAGDCVNVLRGGWVLPAEMERGTWRYQVMTNRMAAVVASRSLTELVVVTAWRTRR